MRSYTYFCSYTWGAPQPQIARVAGQKEQHKSQEAGRKLAGWPEHGEGEDDKVGARPPGALNAKASSWNFTQSPIFCPGSKERDLPFLGGRRGVANSSRCQPPAFILHSPPQGRVSH